MSVFQRVPSDWSVCRQGGSFDVADRMFYSVKKEWESASQDNMSDVRELIPEFYYLPDFLVNSNNIDLGRPTHLRALLLTKRDQCDRGTPAKI